MKRKSSRGKDGSSEEDKTKHRFGGPWTELKLDALRKYLASYAKVMKNQNRLTTWYLDAFAGTGSRDVSKAEGASAIPGMELTQSLSGSAEIALLTEPPFDFYRFGDVNPNHCVALRECAARHGKESVTKVYEMDGNDFIMEACSRIPWSKGNRAVVFLDPYGAQVNWASVEALAKTRATDVWILFPLWIVQRLLARDGVTDEGHAERLTVLFGTEDWRKAFYTTGDTNQTTLFNEIERQGIEVKNADTIAVGEFFKHRLKAIFPGVAPYPRLLVTQQRTPLYFLFFAVASDSPVARNIALDIARHVLEREPAN